MRRVFTEGVDLTLSGRNLYVWTDYSGYDPEINLFGTNAGGLQSVQTTAADRGFDFGGYPIPRVWSLSARSHFLTCGDIQPMRMIETVRGGCRRGYRWARATSTCRTRTRRPRRRSRPALTASIALATGLQGRFAESYGNFAYMAGLVTDEFASTTAALISISDAEQGSVPPGTGIAENVFNSIYRTVRTADDLLAGSDALAGQIDPGTRSGLRALAFALKAESLGEALQSYQRIPINTFGVIGARRTLRAPKR